MSVALQQQRQIDFIAKVRIEWTSGWYNAIVKWWIIEVEGWKVCRWQYRYLEEQDITVQFHVDELISEGDNWLEYKISGWVIGKGDIPQYYESGIASGLRKIIAGGIAGLIGGIIGLTVIVSILYFGGKQVGEALKNIGWGIIAIGIGILIIILALGRRRIK
jgi:hypothetical protein